MVKLFTHPLDKTNRSRLNHLEFLGFAFTKLGRTIRTYFKKASNTYREKRTCETGAMPSGAPDEIVIVRKREKNA
jgi:hypothetical protein